MSVVITGRGYWARMASGQKVRQVPLPKAPKGLPHVARSKSAEAVEKVNKVIADPEFARLTAMRAELGTPIADELLAATKVTRRTLLTSPVDERGILRSTPSEAFDIRVSKKQLDRALQIFDSFVRVADKAVAALHESSRGESESDSSR